LMCFDKDQIIRIETDAMLEACVFSGQVVALRPHQAGFTFGQIATDAAAPRAPTQARSGPYAASSELHLRANRDRRHASGMRLLRPNRGLHIASSGLHLRSNRDRRRAQACAYSGQIGASTPHQADFIFGQIGTDATLQACAYSGQIGALRRIKRTSPSVTTISDGLARAHSMRFVPTPSLTPPKATSKTMPPSRGWHSFDNIAKACSKRKNVGTKGWGNTDLYYTSEIGYKGPPR
jgi:hypothetical protein